jgi:hypothetical protein
MSKIVVILLLSLLCSPKEAEATIVLGCKASVRKSSEDSHVIGINAVRKVISDLPLEIVYGDILTLFRTSKRKDQLFFKKIEYEEDVEKENFMESLATTELGVNPKQRKEQFAMSIPLFNYKGQQRFCLHVAMYKPRLDSVDLLIDGRRYSAHDGMKLNVGKIKDLQILDVRTNVPFEENVHHSLTSSSNGSHTLSFSRGKFEFARINIRSGSP